MYEKYKDLNEKTPEEAAKIVGEVDKHNYFAHSIREIEFAIFLQKRKPRKMYKIHTIIADNKNSKINFFRHGCEIWLARGSEISEDRRTRLILAHELGHLIYNINKLENPEVLENKKASDEQEIYAWKFAYFLVEKKSEEHKNDIQRKKFIFTKDELEQSLTDILQNKKPEIRDEVIKSLFKKN